MKKTIYILIVLLILPITVFGLNENSQEKNKKMEVETIPVINSKINETKNIINKKIDDSTQTILKFIENQNNNLKHTVDFNIDLQSDNDKRQQEIPSSLFGALIALYAGIIVLLSIAMGKIDTIAPSVQKQLAMKLKFLTGLSFISLGLFIIFICIFVFIDSQFLIRFFFQLICLVSALIVLGYTAIKTIHYMSLYNILKELKEKDFNETLKFYINTKEVDKVNRILYEIPEWNFDSNRIKSILKTLNEVLDDEKLLYDKSFFRDFLEHYLEYLFKVTKTEADFKLFKKYSNDIILRATNWFRKGDRCVEAAAVVTEMMPKIIAYSLMTFKKNADSDEFINETLGMLNALCVEILRTQSSENLQNTIINILELFLNPDINLSDDYFNKMLDISGVVSIYIKEYSDKDKNNLQFYNLRVLLKPLIDECFNRRNIDEIQDKIIACIDLHYELMQKKDEIKKYWTVDLASFTISAYNKNMISVISHIVQQWKYLLNSSGENKKYAKYVLEKYKLDTKPEIKTLLKK